MAGDHLLGAPHLPERQALGAVGQRAGVAVVRTDVSAHRQHDLVDVQLVHLTGHAQGRDQRHGEVIGGGVKHAVAAVEAGRGGDAFLVKDAFQRGPRQVEAEVVVGRQVLAAQFITQVGDRQAFPGMAALVGQAFALPQAVRGEVAELDDHRESVRAGNVQYLASGRGIGAVAHDRILASLDVRGERSGQRGAGRCMTGLEHGY
ncbi:hypothetical protein D9M69_495150 [compost metagenome]